MTVRIVNPVSPVLYKKLVDMILLLCQYRTERRDVYWLHGALAQGGFNKNMGEADQAQLRKIGLQAVLSAGSILHAHFRKDLDVRTKKDGSLVTEADVLAEEKIVGIIRANAPSHSILAEESGGEIGEEYTWLIDALDGTSNYVFGAPLFSVALTLLKQQEPVLAFVYNPILREMYAAEKGKGSFLNGKRIEVGAKEDLGSSFWLFNKGRDMESFVRWVKIIDALGRKVRSFRFFGASAWELCQVAQGKAEGCVNIGSQPWDMLGGVLIVREAGGRVTNLEGHKFTIADRNLVATNGRIHRAVLEVIGT